MTGAIGHGFKRTLAATADKPGFHDRSHWSWLQTPAAQYHAVQKVSMTGAIGHGFKLPSFQPIVKWPLETPFSVGILDTSYDSMMSSDGFDILYCISTG